MLISIIVPCLNSAPTLETCLSSIAKQTYSAIEVIVIDGGSTDGTLEILDRFDSIIDIKVLGEDSGIYDAINIGIKKSRGETIGILSADDYYVRKTYIQEVVHTLQNNVYASIVFSTSHIKNWRFGLSRLHRPFKNKSLWLKLGTMPPHPGSFVRSRVYNDIGLYDTSFEIAGDFEFFIRCFVVNEIISVAMNGVGVVMGSGGVSNRGLSSYQKVGIEILRGFKIHNIVVLPWVIKSRILHRYVQFW